MVTDRVRIDSLEAGRAHLGTGERAPGSVVVVAVDGPVPAWLGDLVAAAHRAQATVVVEARTPSGLGGEAAAGWEIGLAAAAFAAGADDVTGIAAPRIARVREITARLDAARPDPGPEDAL